MTWQRVLQQKRNCKKGVDQVSDSCDSYDLTISIKKTEVVYQPAPGKPYKEPTITVKGQRLQMVDKFTYLESTLSRFVHIDDEVNARIAKASAAFGRLRRSIWDRSGIRLDTKLKVYRSVVLPTVLYACETWTVYQRHAKRLNHFHTSCLRKLLKIKWLDRIPDTEVLKRAGMQSIHTLLKLAQLRWTGHVTRMPDERLPKKIFYWEVGKRSHGGQKKRYKDTLKASLKDFNIPTESATGSLELRLVSSAILEHTNNNTSHSWLGLVIVSNDRRTRYTLDRTFSWFGNTPNQ